MRIRDLYSPGAQTARPEQSLAEAAGAMIGGHVGSLVVVDGAGARRRPIGILTDRDIVRGQLRLATDLFCLTVADVMTPEPLTLPIHLGVMEAIEAMHARGVRRAPVVDGSATLVGIVTLDDLLPAVARELGELTTLMGGQARRERTLVA